MRRISTQPKAGAAPSNGHTTGIDDAAAVPVLAWRLRDAAKALGVSDRTLWTWTDEGKVPHVRIGGTILYPVDSLREWLRAKSAEVQPAAANQPADAGQATDAAAGGLKRQRPNSAKGPAAG